MAARSSTAPDHPAWPPTSVSAAIGSWRSASCRTRRRPGVVDAAGRVVCPGFIDVHVHSETALRGNGDIWGSVLQGVTTHLTGPDGFGWSPLPDDAAADLWRSTAFAYGQAELAPELADDRAVLRGLPGDDPGERGPDGPPPGRALRRPRLGSAAGRRRGARSDAGDHPRLDGGRRRRVQHRARLPAGGQQRHARADRAGPRGRPGTAGSTPPTSATRAPAAPGRTASRSRSAARPGIPIRVSHETVDDETEPLLEAARDAGVDFGIDWYVYPAGSSHLLVLLPPEDQIGGYDAVIERVRDPAHRRRIAESPRGIHRGHECRRRPRVLRRHAHGPAHRPVHRRGRCRAWHRAWARRRST